MSRFYTNLQKNIAIKYKNEFYREYFPKDFCFRNNSNLVKITKYQEFITEYFRYNPQQRGLLVYHELGSGKTLTSIYWAINMLYTHGKEYNHVFIISNRVLIKNFYNEVDKFYGNQKEFISKIKSIDFDNYDGKINFENSLIIIDEIQILLTGLLDGDERKKNLFNDICLSKKIKILLLSATPIYHSPFELSPMLYLLSGEALLPRNGKDFRLRYCNELEKNVFRYKEIAELFDGYVSYYIGQTDDINVIAKVLPFEFIYLKSDYLRITEMLNIIGKTSGNVFIYTNNEEYALLISKKLNAESFLINKENAIEVLKIFNSDENINGKISRFIICSKDVMLGISIFNIRNIIIMEPQLEYKEFQQILGRTLRLCSHKNLSEKERNIKTFILAAGNDEYNRYLVSINFDILNTAFSCMLRDIAIDRFLYNIRPRRSIGESIIRYLDDKRHDADI